jgi:DNA-binding transcriptional MerR regulator
MKEIDLISKKELLQLTGISYGQLYRWKRENLIPETWFIKKASFTGQETFFPKDKILKRTSMILELKDKHSLEELAKILSPELTNHSFYIGQLHNSGNLDTQVLTVFRDKIQKEYFSFIELIFIYIISSFLRETVITEDEIHAMVDCVMEWLPKLKDNNYNLLLLILEEKKMLMLARRDAHVLLDSRAEILKNIDLEEISKDLNLSFTSEVEGL